MRCLVVRAAEAAGVRQLQADEQVVGAAEALAVGGDQRVAEVAIAARVVVVDQELIGVGAAVVPHGDRLAAPDQLGPAQAEVLASGGASGRSAGRRRCRPSLPSAGSRTGCRSLPAERVKGRASGASGPMTRTSSNGSSIPSAATTAERRRPSSEWRCAERTWAKDEG